MKLIRHRYLAPAGKRRELLDDRGVNLSASASRMPIFVDATSGTGKSRLLGRLFGWQAFRDGMPLVILDPHGVTIDNFLDKLTRLPPTVPRVIREKLWQRIRYVDMSGEGGYVTPFPTLLSSWE